MANTWYCSGSGNDSNVGSQSSPFRTISKANSVASSGDTILCARGSSFTNGFTVKSGLTIDAYGTGNRPVNSGTWTVRANVTVRNFSITGGGVTRFHGKIFMSDGANNVVFEDCDFHDINGENGGNTIRVDPSCTGFRVTRCTFDTNNISDHIFSRGNNHNMVIEHCIFTAPGGSAGDHIQWQGVHHNVIVRHSTFNPVETSKGLLIFEIIPSPQDDNGCGPVNVPADTTDCEIYGCTFIGGNFGIANNGNRKLTVHDCTFRDIAKGESWGGALRLAQNKCWRDAHCGVDVYNCKFIRCRGAIDIQHNEPDNTAFFFVQNSTFVDCDYWLEYANGRLQTSEARKNLVKNCGRRTGASIIGTLTIDDNFFHTGTATAGTNAITGDTLLDANYCPPQPPPVDNPDHPSHYGDGRCRGEGGGGGGGGGGSNIVWYVSQTGDGSESNDGRTETTPKAFFNATMRDLVNAGDTIKVKRGGVHNIQTVVKPNVTVDAYGDLTQPLPVFTNSGGTAGAPTLTMATDAKINNIKFTGTGDAIRADGANNWSVKQCVFDNITGISIGMVNSNVNVVIASNTFQNSSLEYIVGNAAGIVIEENTFSTPGANAEFIELQTASGIKIRNNTFNPTGNNQGAIGLTSLDGASTGAGGDIYDNTFIGGSWAVAGWHQKVRFYRNTVKDVDPTHTFTSGAVRIVPNDGAAFDNLTMNWEVFDNKFINCGSAIYSGNIGNVTRTVILSATANTFVDCDYWLELTRGTIKDSAFRKNLIKNSVVNTVGSTFSNVIVDDNFFHTGNPTYGTNAKTGDTQLSATYCPPNDPQHPAFTYGDGRCRGVFSGGKSIYVSALSGSNDNDGLAPDRPLAWISTALRMAEAGDKILVERGGTHDIGYTITVENLTIADYGTPASGKPVLRNAGTGVPTIKLANNCILRNLKFTGANHGVQSANASNWTIETCDFDGCGSSGIDVQSGGGTIKGCLFVNNTLDNIYALTSGGLIIDNNTFSPPTNAAGDHIHLDSSNGFDIKNNVFNTPTAGGGHIFISKAAAGNTQPLGGEIHNNIFNGGPFGVKSIGVRTRIYENRFNDVAAGLASGGAIDLSTTYPNMTYEVEAFNNKFIDCREAVFNQGGDTTRVVKLQFYQNTVVNIDSLVRWLELATGTVRDSTIRKNLIKGGAVAILTATQVNVVIDDNFFHTGTTTSGTNAKIGDTLLDAGYCPTGGTAVGYGDGTCTVIPPPIVGVLRITDLTDKSSLAIGRPVGSEYRGDDAVVCSAVYHFNQMIDLGQVYLVNLLATISAMASLTTDDMSQWTDVSAVTDWSGAGDGSTQTELQMRTTEDDPLAPDAVWSEWRVLNIGDHKARGIEPRVVMVSYEPNVTVLVDELSVTARMPGRTFSKRNVVSDPAGTNIVFDPPFKATPSISITPYVMQTGDYFEITAQSRLGFSIIFRNSVGTGVSRTFDWIADGYGFEQELSV